MANSSLAPDWTSSQRGWSERQTKDCQFDDRAIYCVEQSIASKGWNDVEPAVRAIANAVDQ